MTAASSSGDLVTPDRAALDAGEGDAGAARCAAAGGHRGAVCRRLRARRAARAAERRYRPRDPGASRGHHRRAGEGRHQGGADRHRARHRHGRGTSLGRRGISRSRHCGAMSRLTEGVPASRSTPIGARTRRGAISRSTRCISTRTAPCTTRSAGWPISRRIACGLSASRRGASPRTCCACCAITASRRGSAGARATRAARAACRDAVPLLPTLSAERVAQEVLRLLAVADPVPALRMMREDGVLAAILPEATRLDRLERLIAIESSLIAGDAPTPPSPASGRGSGSPSPPPLAGRVGWEPNRDGTGPGASAGGSGRCRCRPARCGWPNGCGCRTRCATGWRGWRRRGRSIRRATGKNSGGRCTGSARERYRDLALLLAAEGRLDREILAELLACAAAWETPRFPIAGRDVTALGIPPGPRIGRAARRRARWWEEGDFRADRAACLARLKELIEQERGTAVGRHHRALLTDH